MKKKAKILEVFSSIQGEGKYAGHKHVFVRFFECNMHCVWCDTPSSIGDTTRHYKEYDVEQIKKMITDFSQGCHAVSFTGGEPLLQKDIIKELLPWVRKQKLLSYLDTNGTLPKELSDLINNLDVVAMDLKLPSSTQQKSYWKEHEAFLKIASRKDVFVKVVISSQTTKEDVQQSMKLVAQIAPKTCYILQPNTYDLSNGVVQKCLDYQLEGHKILKDVRVIPQMHKFMKIR
jgi:organic radical activating enzyme